MKIISKYISRASMAALMLSLASGACLTSCTEDDSTVATKDAGSISIGQFKEDGYSVISYSGQYLDIKPEITSSFSPDELTYEWLTYSSTDNKNYQDTEYDTYFGTDKEVAIGKLDLISTSRDLHYEVNLKPEKYVLVLRVTAPNGVQAYAKTTLQTTTELSEGYYILKETADGNTDFDQYIEDGNVFNSDIITVTQGKPMTGKPLAMSAAFNHSYTDANGKFQYCNLISATTEDGNFKAFSTNDFSEIFNRTNMLYDGALEENEIPYGFCEGVMSIYFITTNGIRSQYSVSAWGGEPGSGLYGIAGGDGGGRFFVAGNYCTVLWNEQKEAFCYSDYNGSSYPAGIEYPGYKCLDCGKTSSGMAYYILEDAAGARKLISIYMDFSGPMLMGDTDIASDSHAAKATDFTVCYSGASFIYSLDGNKVYAYNISNGEETELSFAGLGSSENITYASCNKGTGSAHFILGTQNGLEYTLRFYKMIGGKPDGAPEYECKGSGYVKSVRHTSLSQSGGTEQD